MRIKVLFGVLNWGLGHATRSIPIIDELLKNNHKVYIASDGDALKLLKHQYPDLKFYNLPSYNVKYPYKSIFFNILRYSPSIITAIFKENKEVKKIYNDIKPDAIISDNRYGFRNRNCHNIFITHQVNLQLSNNILTALGAEANKFLIKKFDKLWIPDYKGNDSIAGKLSDKAGFIPHHYIGALSRLQKKNEEIIYDIAIVLSGPEPQKSIFEKIILNQLQKTDKKIILIRGAINNKAINTSGNITIVNFADTSELNDILNKSAMVIARSGYTTVMDMVALSKKAFFVPTPGQSEQEYLAEYLKSKNLFNYSNQKDFDINTAIANTTSPPNIKHKPGLLKSAINQLIENTK